MSELTRNSDLVELGVDEFDKGDAPKPKKKATKAKDKDN